ncbi:MAG TPA: tRNA pseudouridine(55) synthase TruB [Actinomycetota bacterium]
MPAPDGLLVVDKHAGPTSHDVVNRVRRLFATKRVGHAGTLDPPATGILLVGLERATRILQFLQALPKTYRAEVAFGATTTTEDATGTVLDERACSFGLDELRAAAAEMVGEIQQVPPMVSAVRVGGQRLYRAARRGEEVERPARTVTVHALDVARFDAAAWEATLEVRCSSGTYVRTLAADIGERLGCGAHLRALRRTAVGSLGEADAVTVAQLEGMDPPALRAAILPMEAALRDYESVTVSGDELRAVGHGGSLADPGPGPGPGGTNGRPVAVLDPEGRLLAVYRRQGAGLRPAAVLM